MQLLRSVLIRLGTTAITLIGVAVIVFFVIRVVPGNPIAMMLPPGATEADVARLTALYGLDKSIPQQFLIWVSGVLQGDFGTSITTKQPVLALILSRLPATLELSIMALVIAVAIVADDGRPVFFTQTRVGARGRPFRMVKFRSMRRDAEAIKAQLLDRDEGAGVLFKMKDDPRVTRSGRVLRRLSLDELPQFFNVLTGSMSVVGPRPPLPDEVAAYDGDVSRRLLIKPGITGLWQVSGRSNLSWEESVRLDLAYVENWSVTGDIALIARTVMTVLRREGAY